MMDTDSNIIDLVSCNGQVDVDYLEHLFAKKNHKTAGTA
jgi:hypothetical protein